MFLTSFSSEQGEIIFFFSWKKSKLRLYLVKEVVWRHQNGFLGWNNWCLQSRYPYHPYFEGNSSDPPNLVYMFQNCTTTWVKVSTFTSSAFLSLTYNANYKFTSTEKWQKNMCLPCTYSKTKNSWDCPPSCWLFTQILLFSVSGVWTRDDDFFLSLSNFLFC